MKSKLYRVIAAIAIALSILLAGCDPPNPDGVKKLQHIIQCGKDGIFSESCLEGGK